ncbi:MAG: hypothetical protein ACE5LQ_00035 [Candidatus Bipolaricaulia bacterium]
MYKRILLVGLVLGLVGLASVGCIRLVALIVTPSSEIVEGGGSVTFTATNHLGNPVSVTWSVTSGPGTITSAGVYTAPPTVSVVTNATVTATQVGNPSITGSATVTIKPPITASLIDAAGDAWDIWAAGTTVNYDITSIETSRTSTTLTIIITFDLATLPTIPLPGSSVGPGDLAGFITFDTDENSASGWPSANYYLCPFTPLLPAIGVDYFISLFSVNAAGNYNIYRTTPILTPVGEATPTLAGNVLTLTIPLTELGGDDGRTDMNSVLGDDAGPTDCMPDEVAAVVTGKGFKPEVTIESSYPYHDFLSDLGITGLGWTQTHSSEI